ncbi:MAG: hypothetical protein RLZZ511_1196 [Cyanobacteriota bacterium]|jgi:glycosyltransferase involved in cell wall biosynthesis
MKTLDCLSVITITKDDPDGLLQTCRSVRRQVCQPQEHIIIDSSESNDYAPEVIAYLKLDNVYYLHGPDAGIYDGMNKGALIAQCEYLHFLNSGDTYTNQDSIEAIRSLLNQFPSKFDHIFFAWRYLFSSKAYVRQPLPLSLLKSQMTVCHQAVISRRESVIKHRFDSSLNYLADWKFLLACYLSNDLFHIHKNIVLVDFDASGRSSTQTRPLIFESLGIAKELDVLGLRFIRSFLLTFLYSFVQDVLGQDMSYQIKRKVRCFTDKKWKENST